MKAKLFTFCILVLFATVGILVFFKLDNKLPSADSKIEGKSSMSGSRIFALLPQTSESIGYFNIALNGKKSFESGSTSLGSKLMQLSEQLAASNGLISARESIGYFIYTEDETVEGICFDDFGRIDESQRMQFGFAEPPIYSNQKWMPQKSIVFMQGIPLNSAFKISNLDALAILNDLRYITFGDVSFGEGIWESLKDITKKEKLFGLSVLRTGELLSLRDGNSIPGIKSLAVHVETLDEVEQLPKAFPDLIFLSLTLSRELFLDLVADRTLSQEDFSNMKAVRLLNSECRINPWDYFDTNGSIYLEDHRFTKAIFSRSRWLSDSLLYLFTDSRLYTLKELYGFNEIVSHYSDLNIIISGYAFYGSSDRVIPFNSREHQELMVQISNGDWD